MSTRDYPRLPIEEFGKHLLESLDLDPVYVALHQLQARNVWDAAQVKRFLVAYWCLYHCGAAAWLSAQRGGAFWDFLGLAAFNNQPAPTGGRWPRGHERRHWRGAQAIASWEDLCRASDGRPENLVEQIMSVGHSFAAVAGAAQTLRGFGPWISFKICDMLDRCLGHHIDFTEAAVFMFKDPREAALRLWRERVAPSGLHAKPKDPEKAINAVVAYLKGWFRVYQAPPFNDRPIDLQEIETILCKWKSHMNGHYPMYNDIVEIHDGLDAWAHGVSVVQFKSCMPGAAHMPIATSYAELRPPA